MNANGLGIVFNLICLALVFFASFATQAFAQIYHVKEMNTENGVKSALGFQGDKDRLNSMTLDAEEFIRRFLWPLSPMAAWLSRKINRR